MLIRSFGLKPLSFRSLTIYRNLVWYWPGLSYTFFRLQIRFCYHYSKYQQNLSYLIPCLSNNLRVIIKLLKYYKYPFTTDLTLGDASNISTSFPVVTVCLNSMHSRLKILENYNNSEVNKQSEFAKITDTIQLLIKSLGFLYGFYADTHDATMRDIVKTLKSTGSLILTKVLR